MKVNRIKLKLLLLCFLSFGALATPQPEEAAITQTINNYFDGYNRGDVELLKKTFHPDCVIKYLDIRSGKYSTFTMPQLFKFMDNLPKGWASKAKLYSIDHHGSAAQAKVSVTILGGKLTWTDYISLLKLDGVCTIVSKVSHGDFSKK